MVLDISSVSAINQFFKCLHFSRFLRSFKSQRKLLLQLRKSIILSGIRGVFLTISCRGYPMGSTGLAMNPFCLDFWPYNEALLCCGPACGIDHYNVVLWACGLDLWQKLWPMAQPFWPDLAAVRPNLCTVVWPCRRKWGVSLAVGILAIASIAYARANPL